MQYPPHFTYMQVYMVHGRSHLSRDKNVNDRHRVDQRFEDSLTRDLASKPMSIILGEFWDRLKAMRSLCDQRSLVESVELVFETIFAAEDLDPVTQFLDCQTGQRIVVAATVVLDAWFVRSVLDIFHSGDLVFLVVCHCLGNAGVSLVEKI
jgi:hypothetical protein